MANEKGANTGNVPGELRIRGGEVVVSAHQLERPDGEIGTHLALGHAFHGNVPVRALGAHETGPDEYAG